MSAGKYHTRLRKSVLLIYITIHFAISHFVMPFYNKVDYFPFYNWNLFSFNPSKLPIYTIRVLEVDNVKLSEPVIFSNNRPFFNSKSNYMASHQIRRFGEYLRTNAPEHLQKKARLEMERNLFPKFSQVTYEIIGDVIDYRDFIRHPDYSKLNVLQRYSFDSKVRTP